MYLTFVAKNIDSVAKKKEPKKLNSRKAFHLEVFSSAAECAWATPEQC